MKRLQLSLVLIAFAFTTSIGYAEKSTPVKEQPQLFSISSNAP
ncbi:hypothetical protein [Flavobacterium sp. 102]|nr:hypothetical protein [Flavobacterium sp. 102]RKS00429.1 hypothetical protein C8C84_0039 [Flavobacterium sp. 102]